MASTNPSSGESSGPLPLKIMRTLWESYSGRRDAPERSAAARREPQPEQVQVEHEDTTFKWKRLWPVPLYGVAFLVHKGLRVRFPRKWRPLTPFKLPEVYGSAALGHAAYIEGNRLSRKIVQDPYTNAIDQFAEAFKTMCLQSPQLQDWDNRLTLALIPYYEKGVELGARTIDPGTFGYTGWMTAMFWSDPVALTLASTLLLPRCEAAGMSLHDAKVLVTFMSQRLSNPDFYRVPISGLGSLSFLAALFFLSEWDRSGWRRGTRLLVNCLQRVFFYSIGTRWLGGYYHYYASIWELEDLPKAAAVVVRAHGCQGLTMSGEAAVFRSLSYGLAVYSQCCWEPPLVF